MRILVVGGGAREHAIVNHMRVHSGPANVIAAPGNPGIAELCPVFDIAATDVDGLVTLALAECVDITIVGPEAALEAGVTDALRANGIAVLGPGREGARLETSKAWAKDLMQGAGIPTAFAERFTGSREAIAYLEKKSVPIVVKADGLAAGKGAVVCRSHDEARAAIVAMLDGDTLGGAGATILIEDFLVGEEYSMMVFTDGETLRAMPLSQDHKPVGDGDQGPNTGGMGAYAPVPGLEHAAQQSLERIFLPLLGALKERSIDYRGVITGNFIWTSDGPYVIEFNARFGDPEAEVTLPLLETDLVEIARHIDARTLDSVDVRWNGRSALCVVLASAGYPGEVRTGDAITGTDRAPVGAQFLHAATAMRDDELITHGGRVIIATATGDTFAEARTKAYRAVDAVEFAGKHYRSDIGWRAVARSEVSEAG